MSHPDIFLMLWATLVIKDPVTACSAVLLAKRCMHVRLQSQGIARKINSPLRSGINPHLTQAAMTNACWGRGAPRGKTLVFLVLQEHTFALPLLNSASLGHSPFGAGCWGLLVGDGGKLSFTVHACPRKGRQKLTRCLTKLRGKGCWNAACIKFS